MNFKFDEFFPIINIINSHGRQEEAKKQEKERKKQLMTQCVGMLEQFQTDEAQVLTFPSTLERFQRKTLHSKAQEMGLLPKYNINGEFLSV